MLSGRWVIALQRKYFQHSINVKLTQILRTEQKYWWNSRQKCVSSPEISSNEWDNISFFYWSTKVYICKMRQKLLNFLNVCGNKMPTRCSRLFLYCRSYCLLNMFRAPLHPSSGAQEYYTGGCCLWYLVLWFSSCRSGVKLCVVCPVCCSTH